MKALIVKIRVKTEYIQQFEEITRYNSENSRKEPGNLRFDILRNESDSTEYYLYEVYKDDLAIASHRETPHYNKWRDTVADMMQIPRESIRATTVYPLDQDYK